METRALFWGLDAGAKLAFYLIGYAAIGVCLWGVLRAVAKCRRAAPSAVALDLGAGVLRMLRDLATHRRLRRRDALAGGAHAAIFAGFALLFAGTSIITLEVDILDPLLGIRFWKGGFFLVFSLVLDLAGCALAAGIALMMLRRAAFGLERLDYVRRYRGESTARPAARRWKIEDWIFLGSLLLIVLTGFLQEGLRHAMEQPAWGLWEPVGEGVGAALRALQLSPAALAGLRLGNWWFHGLAALCFVGAIPWWKAKHMLAVLSALAARDPLALRRLPRTAPQAASVGAATIADFSWKDMLDLDACTKCGRCHEACPARAAGYRLSPRDLILDLRLHNDRVQGRAAAPGQPAGAALLAGGVIETETLWACRSCGACQEICPVGVEHPVKIIQMRRQLVERGAMDPLLKNTLDTIAATGNSFGENGRKRPAWTRALGFRVKDIRTEPAELLWFVGDYASFDPRNQVVSRTFARLLRAAGRDFALLHEGEKTAGNDVRRVGEEGLFESLVEHNLGQMAAARPFRSIVTTDPHSFNTLRNEYPQFGAVAPIQHYTEVLCELLEAGALKVTRPLGRRVTFHDPCHLGRLNRRFDAPRRVLELIGCTLVEMPRNRENSFCCGAGGGRIWIPDQPGTTKPSELRVREAAGLERLEVFVTSCPKDLTMFEDARKTAGFEKAFVVQDIAELVAEAVSLNVLLPQDLPDLGERIAAAVADRVAAVVGERLDALLAARGPLLPAPAAPAAQAPAVPAPPAAVPVAARVPSQRVALPWSAQPVRAAVLPPYERPERSGPRILVPVKQVGKLGDEYRFEPDGRSIAPGYFEYQLNEWDDTALEQALRLVESLGRGEVVAVTVGPPEADEALRKALAKGAHRAVRVWDAALADADPIAVARMLAGVAQQEQPDLVIAGAQSADQANGATGTALARLLGWTCTALVVDTEWDGGATLSAVRELEGGLRHSVRIAAPAVITMQTGANTPRYATMRMIKQARQKPLAVVEAGGEAGAYAAARIAAMAAPPQTRARMLEGTPAEVAAALLQLIRDKMGSRA
jgi:Fe-S oxidoreductase/electron transfer flavoprotein alpha/beta subunit